MGGAAHFLCSSRLFFIKIVLKNTIFSIPKKKLYFFESAKNHQFFVTVEGFYRALSLAGMLATLSCFFFRRLCEKKHVFFKPKWLWPFWKRKTGCCLRFAYVLAAIDNNSPAGETKPPAAGQTAAGGERSEQEASEANRRDGERSEPPTAGVEQRNSRRGKQSDPQRRKSKRPADFGGAFARIYFGFVTLSLRHKTAKRVRHGGRTSDRI